MLDKKLGDTLVRTFLIRIEAHEFHIGAVRRGFGRCSIFVHFFQALVVIFEYSPHFEDVYGLSNELRRIGAATEKVQVLPTKGNSVAKSAKALDRRPAIPQI